MARLVVGGGCFWCIEAAMKDLRGVHGVRPGYAGGHVEHPTYEQVCAKRTGHAEVVEFDYDETIIDHATMLRVFFTAHDPTQRNRQGNDVGP
ncbi:MAG TPA: peptide-methionine (S)-S-oxide reductase, partial [Candidatus Poseidoniales archaeon]